MKRLIFTLFLLFISLTLTISYAKDTKTQLILLIFEQNIEGPQRAWWASEIDLSTTEMILAKRLIEQGYDILEPSNLSKIIKQNRAFRIINLSEEKSIKLARLSRASYVVLGKAIASSGSNVPQSSMRSCFANITVKLIRVKDGKVIAYLDAAGNSVHTDVITGGKEALINAGEDLAIKIIDALSKERGE